MLVYIYTKKIKRKRKRGENGSYCSKALMNGKRQVRKQSNFNKLFVVQLLETDFELDPYCITNIPLWITLFGQLVGYYSGELLRKFIEALVELFTQINLLLVRSVSLMHVNVLK